MIGCIIVLCPNLDDAHLAFLGFLNYVDDLYPLDYSTFVDSFANIIDTHHGMRYIFCDETMQNVYRCISDDLICVDEFMEGIEQYDIRKYRLA